VESRIRRNIFILIGVTVLLLIGMVLGWFFVLVRPLKEQIAQTQTTYESTKAEADKLPAALKAQKQAEDRRQHLQAQLTFFQNRYRSFTVRDIGDPATGTPVQKANREEAWRRYMREYFSDFGQALRATLVRVANAADDPRDGQKFVINTTVKVDAPPRAPEDLTFPSTGLLKPTSATTNGTLNVTVNGTFAEIKTFLNNITRQEVGNRQQKPILFVVGNVRLAGTSPRIEATFTLTPYLLVRGPGLKLQASAAGAAPAFDPNNPEIDPITGEPMMPQ
jgi:hypothetical protein